MLTATKPRKRDRVELFPANVAARKILNMLSATMILIDEWQDEHGPDCSCRWCSRQLSNDGETYCESRAFSDAAIVARDLAGLRWALLIGSESLDSCTIDPTNYDANGDYRRSDTA